MLATSISVGAYGADATGATPSDTAFLNAFKAVGGQYNKVLVPCGNYLINSAQLFAPVDNFEFYGNNQCATITLGPNYPKGASLFSNNGRKGVKVHDLRFTGSGSTNSHSVLFIAPNLTGDTNAEIYNVYIRGVGSVLKATQESKPIVGLTIRDSNLGDTLSSAIILNNVSNFKFTNNIISNWVTDGVNYEMSSDVSNWTVTNNSFSPGPKSWHALSQGPVHPQFVINKAVFSNNQSISTVVGLEGQGGGFGIECNDCLVQNNTFSAPLNPASGWRSCLEVYGASNIDVSGNSCDNGTLLLGTTVEGAHLDGMKAYNNNIKTLGRIAGNTMSCINFGAIAGTGTVGSRISNVQITNNICDATQAVNTGDGILGIVVGRSTWVSVANLTVSGNTVSQPRINQAIRVVNPTQSQSGLVIANNIAPQGLSFKQTTAYSNNAVTGNDFRLTGIIDTTGSQGTITYSQNILP